MNYPLCVLLGTYAFAAVTHGFCAPMVGGGKQPDGLRLWYETPAARWQQEALPIGNAFMGAMLFGGLQEERIQFNEESLWNDSNNPPWRCDYHTDINLQMNYWPADVANLSECFQPYADWIHSIREVRTEATLRDWKKPGWLMRGESGLFGGSTWKWIPGTSAWLLQNSYDHYRFTRDLDYLRSRAYPAMKEVCAFWIASLETLPVGTLVTPEGLSPEHGPMERGISFDRQMVWDLFTNTIEAADALGVDKELRI